MLVEKEAQGETEDYNKHMRRVVNVRDLVQTMPSKQIASLDATTSSDGNYATLGLRERQRLYLNNNSCRAA